MGLTERGPWSAAALRVASSLGIAFAILWEALQEPSFQVKQAQEQLLPPSGNPPELGTPMTAPPPTLPILKAQRFRF